MRSRNSPTDPAGKAGEGDKVLERSPVLDALPRFAMPSVASGLEDAGDGGDRGSSSAPPPRVADEPTDAMATGKRPSLSRMSATQLLAVRPLVPRPIPSPPPARAVTEPHRPGAPFTAEEVTQEDLVLEVAPRSPPLLATRRPISRPPPPPPPPVPAVRGGSRTSIAPAPPEPSGHAAIASAIAAHAVVAPEPSNHARAVEEVVRSMPPPAGAFHASQPPVALGSLATAIEPTGAYPVLAPRASSAPPPAGPPSLVVAAAPRVRLEKLLVALAVVAAGALVGVGAVVFGGQFSRLRARASAQTAASAPRATANGANEVPMARPTANGASEVPMARPTANGASEPPTASAGVAPSDAPTSSPPTRAASAPAAPAADVAAASASRSPGPPAPSVDAQHTWVTFGPASRGHRLYLDGSLASYGTAPAKLRCGTHAMKIGSQGQAKRVDFPCGGSFELP